MAQKKGGGSKAGALLKTMGRGSPRTRAPETPPEALPDEDAAPRQEPSPGPEIPRATPTGDRGRARAATKPRRKERPAKPVRITVDLDAERHRFLRDFAYGEDVRGTEVVRGLLDLLRDDPAVADELRERLAEEG